MLRIKILSQFFQFLIVGFVFPFMTSKNHACHNLGQLEEGESIGAALASIFIERYKRENFKVVQIWLVEKDLARIHRWCWMDSHMLLSPSILSMTGWWFFRAQSTKRYGRVE